MQSIHKVQHLGKYSYDIRRRRGSRTIRLSVHRDGNVVVSAPWYVSDGSIEHFVASKTKWIISTQARMRELGSVQPIRRLTRAELAAHKIHALEIVMKKVAHFTHIYGFRYGAISIRNQRSRWGSCSKNGNLSFNYKIALLPDRLAEYLVVHEVCHLGEFNHSSAFWALVAKCIPDYVACRKELKAVQL